MKKKLSLFLVLIMLLSLISTMGTQAQTTTGYVNIAQGATYTASTPYTLRTNPNDYQLIDGKELTDGVKGSSAFGTEWHGFYNTTDGSSVSPYFVTIDLGSQKTDIKKLSIEFQHNSSSGINKPISCRYYSSTNGTDFTELGLATPIENGSYYDFSLILNTAISGRYFKAIIVKDTNMFTFASEFEICTEGEVEVPVNEADLIDVRFNSGCVLTEDNLFGVPLETNYSDFLLLLRSEAGITVKDKNGNIKTSGFIVTGDVLEKTVGAEVTDTKTIVVEGDVNGDGKITGTDYLLIKRTYLGTYTLAGEYKRAACVTNEVSITPQDYLKIKRNFLGSYNIHTKYERVIEEYDMTFQAASSTAYKMSCTYAGKPLYLTFDKKTWGTWNIGTFSYNGKALAGGGTDWEYVYRSGPTAATSSDFTGGNHGNEQLVEIKFYDGSTGEELKLNVGQSKDIKNLLIVEKTKILFHNTTTAFCDVVRTYIVVGNKITLEVTYDYIKDTYHGLSYTCMFPVAKTHGLYITFNNIDGTTKTVETLKVGAADYSGPQHGKTNAMNCKIWGYVDPTWTFDVEVYSQKDSCDNFKNANKTFYWDMNTTHNKLYFSKYSNADLVKAGSRFDTKSSWTFYIDESNVG
ncbi:MAG: hypothetical protein A2Y15_06165 [Clostridiales bacterium GWF2_36_10]|nr:MAG: hypothetical protein A2Y15_06165 [Clostridiales bacterium GWF2_36_10]HAN21899.1 hypothetical protein [Clostridiales bacterium]